MSKFTKTLVAAAISGLVSTSAMAADYGCVNGVYATAQGKQAKLDVNGSKCDKLKVEVDMTLFVGCDFNAGANTGTWQSTVFDFGLEGNGEGPYIASKPGKTLVMDQSGNDLFDFENFMDDYVANNCENEDGYNYDTELKKFEAKVSKNGDKVKVRWDSEGTWDELDTEKDRKVKTKLRANLDNVD